MFRVSPGGVVKRAAVAAALLLAAGCGLAAWMWSVSCHVGEDSTSDDAEWIGGLS